MADSIKNLIQTVCSNFLRVSHIIYWNIITGKATYKKFLNLQETKDFLKDIINSW